MLSSLIEMLLACKTSQVFGKPAVRAGRGGRSENVLQFVCGAECGAGCVAELEPEACRRDLARFC